MKITTETTTIDILLNAIEKELPALSKTQQVEYMIKYQELYKQKYSRKK